MPRTTCSRCSEHPLAPGHKNWCRPCLNEAQRRWNASEAGPRYRRYRLTKSDIAVMRLMQGARCDICGDQLHRSEHVDHDHSDNQTRSLLCGPCNQGLGQFGDSPARLRSAAAYLERWVV